MNTPRVPGGTVADRARSCFGIIRLLEKAPKYAFGHELTAKDATRANKEFKAKLFLGLNSPKCF